MRMSLAAVVLLSRIPMGSCSFVTLYYKKIKRSSDKMHVNSLTSISQTFVDNNVIDIVIWMYYQNMFYDKHVSA